MPAQCFGALPGISCSPATHGSSSTNFHLKGQSLLGSAKLGGRSSPYLQPLIRQQDVSVSGSQNPDVEVQGDQLQNPGTSNGTYDINLNGNAAALSLQGVNGAVPASASLAGAQAASAAADAPLDLAGLPHRWRIVIMMAVGFVLCNMDKVGREHHTCVTWV